MAVVFWILLVMRRSKVISISHGDQGLLLVKFLVERWWQKRQSLEGSRRSMLLLSLAARKSSRSYSYKSGFRCVTQMSCWWSWIRCLRQLQLKCRVLQDGNERWEQGTFLSSVAESGADVMTSLSRTIKRLGHGAEHFLSNIIILIIRHGGLRLS